LKLQALKETLSSMKSVLVAYSGGVDSTLLLKVAKDVLGDNVVAVTATSPTYPSHEVENALKIATDLGVKLVSIETDELSDPRFSENSPERCYWCKRALFLRMTAIAKEYGLNYILDGSNYDDTKDFRPGMRAANELGVRSPLKEVGLTKDDIRSLSKSLGLPTWDKPSFACFSSRFPYGMKITEENLAKVESAEKFLRKFGISQIRVRHYNETARIEVMKDDMPRLLDEGIRREVLSYFKKLGYSYVTLDLEGYRTGSMNEVLKRDDKK